MAEAARLYPEHMDGLLVIDGLTGGKVAHRPLLAYEGVARSWCGLAQGACRDAQPSDMVCLKCFPWWVA